MIITLLLGMAQTIDKTLHFMMACPHFPANRQLNRVDRARVGFLFLKRQYILVFLLDMKLKTRL